MTIQAALNLNQVTNNGENLVVRDFRAKNPYNDLYEAVCAYARSGQAPVCIHNQWVWGATWRPSAPESLSVHLMKSGTSETIELPDCLQVVLLQCLKAHAAQLAQDQVSDVLAPRLAQQARDLVSMWCDDPSATAHAVLAAEAVL